ncbi:MAG: hypothetical protein CMG34_07280 [Candidatus Marinimicrobia bacterium]|nr:hypothetical protein [Candidatus Neomarinimicrobiota bacterium]
MPGISAGKTWSRIGAEVAPTSSTASGVWQIGEVAENVGAGTWPTHVKGTMEYIAQYAADGSTGEFEFTSIPQKYRSLRIVMSQGKRVGTGTNIGIWFNGDSTGGNYGYSVMYGYGSNASYLFSRNSGTINMGDCPTGNVNDSQIWMCDIANYSNASTGTTCHIWQGANQQGGNNTGIGGFAYSVASAITTIEINSSGYNPGLSYNYDTPTLFTLFGIGLA